MTPIETLNHLCAERDALTDEINDRYEKATADVKPQAEHLESIEKTIRSYHKSYVNSLFKGKYYLLRPEKMENPIVKDRIYGFKVVGYTDDADHIGVDYIPVIAVEIESEKWSGMKNKDKISYRYIWLYMYPAEFPRSMKTSYERFVYFIEEYCKEVTREEFDEFIMESIHTVEEVNNGNT